MRTFLALLLALAAVLPQAASAQSAPAPGTLIKLACPARAAADHPCTAVYWNGGDGKRHAFPNGRVFLSWFADFSGVRTVSASALAAIPLGANVTYRPGVKLVKFQTLEKTYAVGLGGELRWVKDEGAARALYGQDWNRQVDDIADAFFPDYRFGADIASADGFSRAAETSAAASIDDGLDSSFRALRVTTPRGAFDVELVKLTSARFMMITDVAADAECIDACPTKPLAEMAAAHGAAIGIHGTYYCPPDYAECAGKVGSFLWPVYDSASGRLINAANLPFHDGPMIAEAADGRRFHFHRAKDFGGSVASFENVNGAKLQAAMAHFPSLVEGGNVVVEAEPRLDEKQRSVKAVRGAIGWDGRSTYLAVVRSATVIDLAFVMRALGATSAMNLDGGGTTALLYDGKYQEGPGRPQATAILFKPR